MGELCRRDADCESGLVCDVSAAGGPNVCRAPMVVAKQYAEECSTSSDCDITRYNFFIKLQTFLSFFLKAYLNILLQAFFSSK